MCTLNLKYSMKCFFLSIFLLIFFSCRNENRLTDFQEDNEIMPSTIEVSEYFDIDENYNGTYCAEVEYYNPNTGTRSAYELEVEVEDGMLVQINWPNGGWLDETHFITEDISSGECEFTSDKGYQFTVTLGEKGGNCFNDGYQLRKRVNEDVENTTCSICGDEKEEFDEYCYSCAQKIEDEELRRLEEEE